jgi:acetylornithine/succinyldiaminopimelate/putrescine aminotransferase
MMMDEVQTGMGRTGKLWGYENFEGMFAQRNIHYFAHALHLT